MDITTPVNQNEQAIQCLNLGVTQRVTVATASAQLTSALNAATRVIRVAVSTDCHILLGPNPTALTTSAYLPAGSVEYFRVLGSEKVAFISSAIDGFATVTEMA